eukprot:GHVP01065383.1.p1 GENE.GHVP01065383.1~~GHVP01065383.1.p1  ORF type:complete len:414 (+),score=57.90 GHVP01065383.1:478-1719(+)
MDSTVLFLASLGVTKDFLTFPFPTPVDPDLLKTALTDLLTLGALVKDEENWEVSISDLGKAFCRLPLPPRYAKMILSILHLAMSLEGACDKFPAFLTHGILVICSLATSSDLVYNEIKSDWPEFTDDLHLLNYLLTGFANSLERRKFCSENNLQLKVLTEVTQLAHQITQILKKNFVPLTHRNLTLSLRAAPATERDMEFVRKSVLSGLVDRIASRNYENRKDQFTVHMKPWLKCTFHQTSVLSRNCEADHVVYNQLLQMEKGGSQNFAEDTDLASLDSPIIARHPVPHVSPIYDTETGTVRRYFRLLHRHCPDFDLGCSWEICETAYEIFSEAFITGQVCSRLAPYSKFRLHRPSEMLALGRTLARHGVASKEKLYEMWTKVAKQFLLLETLSLFSTSQRNLIRSIWPPMDK